MVVPRKCHLRAHPEVLRRLGLSVSRRTVGRPVGRSAGRLQPSSDPGDPPHHDLEPARHGRATHHRREDLGRPRRQPGPRRTRRPGRRPAPRPRGDLAAGLHRPPRARPHGATPVADRRDGRPLHPDHAAQPPDARPGGGGADRPARDELPRVRHPAPRHRLAVAGHRPRHRPADGPDPAGHDHRVRRFAHEHAWRVRGARVRDRNERGRDGSRDPDPAPARSPDV